MSMELGELLHTDRTAVCTDPQDSLLSAVERMTAARSGCVFVVGDRNKLLGAVTDGDVRRALDRHGEIEALKVADVMTKQPVCRSIADDTSLVSAFRQFAEHRVSTLPVVDHGGRYVGYVEFHEVAKRLSPERIYPRVEDAGVEDADENVRRHRARYEFAAQFVERGAVVLDCACGSGYGSAMLAQKAAVVVGVDKSREAIDYAEAHYRRLNLYYRCMRLEDLHWEHGEEQVVGYPDVVVTLETLEHVSEDVCRIFLRDAGQWIKPGGVLVASSPMLRYRDGRPYVTSPYHVNEMPKAALLAMFAECLPGYVIHYYHQKQDTFLPLLDEDTGFMVVVARRQL